MTDDDLLARADEFEGAIVVSGEDEATRLVRGLAAALRARDDELAAARQADEQNGRQLEQAYERLHATEKLEAKARAELAAARTALVPDERAVHDWLIDRGADNDAVWSAYGYAEDERRIRDVLSAVFALAGTTEPAVGGEAPAT